MANYLVTGGAGFIGSNIAEYLVGMGESVRILDNFSTGYDHNIAFLRDRIDVVEGDVRNPDDCARAVSDMDYVLHQAALPSVSRSVEDPLNTHENCITGTVNLLMAARDARVRRVVYAASSSAYGNQDQEYKTEDMRPDPLSPYGVAKLASEYYLKAFSECYGMETVSLRYFNVFGPRQDPSSMYSGVISLFITRMLAGDTPAIQGDGGQSRDFTFVENNVRANILAATADFPAQGQVYNIACGLSVTILELFEAVREIVGADVTPAFGPSRVGDVRHSKADISRARRDLGYEPTVSFKEGLSRTIDWYAAHQP